MAFHSHSHLFEWNGLDKTKTPGGKKTPDHLRDHKDASAEAQALLSKWMSSKLQLEDEGDLTSSFERKSTAAATSYGNFDDLYSSLSEEKESRAVKAVLKNLMEREVLDGAMMEKLALDEGQRRKMFIDPAITMEVRHLQVRQNRAQREVARLRKQSEIEAQQDARREAKRREELREVKDLQRQEHLLQNEMARLRRQVQERRCREQPGRQREKEKVEATEAIGPQPAPGQQQAAESLYKEKSIHTMIHMRNLKCLQKHFSIWRSTALDQRLLMDKTSALYDWKRKLRVWRAWRAVVWAKQKQREVRRAEQELRVDNRKCQIATKNYHRRLLQRCLAGWHLCCRMQRERDAILAQQEETRHKMAALIDAVSTSKLDVSDTPDMKPVMTPPEAANHQEKKKHHRSETFAPGASAHLQRMTSVGHLANPSQTWHVTCRHAAPTAAELQEAGGRVEHSGSSERAAWQRGRTQRVPAEPGGVCTPQRQSKPTRSHPIIMATEARARRRAERWKAIEEQKRRRAEEKLAAMKAAEEQMQREREEEKRRSVQKREEEKRREKEREEEKQREIKRQQELQKLARQHYSKNLLSRRGLLPWKRLSDLSKAKMKLAGSHYNRFLLRRCALGWHQSAKASQSDKRASADQLYQRLLLQRSLSCWKRIKVWRTIQEEQAKHLYHTHTLRRFLLALCDHVTQQRLLYWDQEELAHEHHNRQVLRRCFLAWGQLPQIQHEERVKEGRRERLACKVVEVLPDFRLQLAETLQNIWDTDTSAASVPITE
ncbi:coiled-coil domain-containing protein 191 isoform X1 [Takifugu flavidus]|uniref:coiled-coil domain-containing protein 191 isoform X1 n=1 Tax=Takifugu flavidus TaxID=433684 RepID=UPI002544411D|nr:coiled-coil domain-containing protein 191 isoform X1 [Takifugu flavidus]